MTDWAKVDAAIETLYLGLVAIAKREDAARKRMYAFYFPLDNGVKSAQA